MKRKETIYFTSIFLFLLSVNIFLGKDLNWDQTNYHLYGAHLLMQDRWGQDYFAGSFQGYLNPISYVPLYLMVTNGWNPVFISVVIFTFHYANFVIIFLITKKIAQDASDIERFLIAIFAITSGIFLVVMGSSFNDAVCSALVLLALLYLMGNSRHQFLIAGFLVGVACALKMTQGIYAIAFCVIIFFLSDLNRNSEKIKRIFIFCISSGVGFLIFHGYWSYKLWLNFKNPFFPAFNGIFKSKDFHVENFQDTRFMGDYWWGMLKLPFEMLLPNSWIYTESALPEIKLAVFFILSIWIFLIFIFKKNVVNFSIQEKKVIVFFVLTLFLWMMASRIGRYALATFLISAPVILILMVKIFNGRTRVFLICFFLMSQVILLKNADFRKWNPHDWGAKWINIEFPQKLKEKPHVFLSAGNMSMSFLTLYLHPGSSFVNISGQYDIPYKDGYPEKLDNILSNNMKKYIVVSGLNDSNDFYEVYNGKIMAYGWRITSNCDFAIMKEKSWLRSSFDYYFKFCELSKAEGEDVKDFIKKVSKYDVVFEHVEKICGQHYPKNTVTTMLKDSWVRNYVSSQTSIYIENDGVYADGFRILSPKFLGLTQEVLMNKTQEICPDIYKKRYLH